MGQGYLRFVAVLLGSLGSLGACSSSEPSGGGVPGNATGGAAKDAAGVGGSLNTGGLLEGGGGSSVGGASGQGGTSQGGGMSTGGSADPSGGAQAAGGTMSSLGGAVNSGGAAQAGGLASSLGGSVNSGAGVSGAGGAAVVCTPEGSACSATGTCCGGECVDTSRNIRNCGACGVACGAANFCATVPSVACTAAVLKNLCQNTHVTSVLDGAAADDAASAVVRTALISGCTPTPISGVVEQASTNVIHNITGKPRVGPGELLVAVGGDAYSRLVGYLNTERSAPIYNVDYDFRRSLDQSLVKTGSGLSADHDFLVIQAVRDPSTGTLILVAYGLDAAGTTAAGWYFANVMLPSLTSYTNAWYVYEWMDTVDDNMPTNATEFQLIQSGN